MIVRIFGRTSILIKIFLKVFYFIHLDIMLIYSNKKFFGQRIIFLIIFLEIRLINFLGLFPFIFTPSSHLRFAFMLSIFLWLGSQLISWVLNRKMILAHLVPEGTPFLLIPFLVIIEIIRNLIRPLTLRIRLVANMSAGHLLLSLLGSGIRLDKFWVIVLIIFILILFIILEIRVAFIQAYVFIRLTSLYVKEVE